ncbi:MAG TPA: choice-of-anchor J domain-containing protein [Fulvivirga sp.]|nr:choice-of-anchor J domain-containing protein [Fulvivirga sp.]
MFCFQLGYAQERCGTVIYQELLREHNKKLETTDQFEDWLSKKISKKQAAQKEEATIVTIPVVVHIVHNGEPLGTGMNIPDDQIYSQIEVLNEDFRRMNDDRSNTPTTFQPVAADVELQFVLAARDPEGLPTDGITRTNGERPLWELSDNYALKAISYWPAEDYLNIWVTDLGSKFLGYAQFPVSNLDGLETSSENGLTDGVVIDYFAFGSKLKVPSANIHSTYDRGRTATHEIGHFFGLRHIWGDGGCSVDDYCADTPLASTDHGNLNNCTFPGPNTCSNESPDLPDMFQNFMDYTDDVCMNLFTLDQKTRIRTVLDNSPRRASLVTSKGAIAPVSVANDIGIRNIIAPQSAVCGDVLIPEIEIRNYGTNAVSSVSISFNLNGGLMESKSFNVTLDPLEITSVSFSEIALPAIGVNTFNFEVSAVNSSTDNNADNNQKEINVTIPPNGTLPVRVNFDQLPTDWNITNSDGLTTWETFQAPNSDPANMSLGINFYNYENEGDLDVFTSPVFDLSERTTAQLSFDLAYAKYFGKDSDGLIVTISENCSSLSIDTVYFKSGEELATVGPTSSNFVPTSSSDWRNETIDLASYLGLNAVQINFIAKNGYGNNLYIDNIIVDDVKNQILSPSPASCMATQDLTVEVVNSGNTAISNFDIHYSLDGGNLTTTSFTLLSPLEVGFSAVVSTTLPNLSIGGHLLEVTIDLPNSTENEVINHQFYIDQSVEVIPIRESFEDFGTSTWLIANHDQGITWQVENGEKGNYLMINNADYVNINQNDWLISPSLDFTQATSATLTFEVAYSGLNNPNDGLALYISTDCGENYFLGGYNKIGKELYTSDFQDTPGINDWRFETVDLSQYLGNDQLRLAFVSTNKNGADIYLDDIQIYVTDLFPTRKNDLYPNPTVDGIFNLIFDLDKKELVKIMVYDLSGHLVLSETLPNTLNQQYTFDLSGQPQGIYILRAIGESFALSRRVMKND